MAVNRSFGARTVVAWGISIGLLLGFATELVLEARAPDGFRLWTFEPNAGAIRFYERHGLTTLARTDGSGNEERVPDRLMAWEPEPKRAS